MTTNQQNIPYLELKNLEKVYSNGEKAVYNFNLDIDKNEFIVIVGPSGCGKSTTLRMIAGLEDISSGDIYMEGDLLNYKACKDRKMAIVFQSYALYPQMSVYENIAFPLTINKYEMGVTAGKLYDVICLQKALENADANLFFSRIAEIISSKEKQSKKIDHIAAFTSTNPDAVKILLGLCKNIDIADGVNAKQTVLDALSEERRKLSEEMKENGVSVDDDGYVLDETGNRKTEMRKCTPYEIKTRVYETAEKLDLKPYLDKIPKELSGGQMQRVALGRAIIKNVPVFLMDEPLSNLDAKLRITMRSEIVKLHNRINATTIYVTHDQTEAMTMATRIVVMSRGFVQQIGTPDEIYGNPDNVFVAKFIGSPTMNLFDATFDPTNGAATINGAEVACPDNLVSAHDEFYKKQLEMFGGWNDNFDGKAKEGILRILSATGELRATGGNNKKQNIFSRIKEFFEKKASENKVAETPEQICCKNKLAALQQCDKPHNLTLGIRPESIVIKKCHDGENYDGMYITKPTVCELLGGEYNVYFDYNGVELIGTFKATERLSVHDSIAIGLPKDSLYVFDPISGGRIC